MPIYSRDKKWIRERDKLGMTPTQIQASFRKKLDLWDICKIVKTFNKLQRQTINGEEYLRCNTCGNVKKYCYENFQITECSKQTKCRACRNLVRRNKRKVNQNIWYKLKDINNTRRWWRTKIMRLIDIDYYKSWYKPGYLKVEKDVNYFRRINIKKICN